jgi:hypothetical protein
MIGRSAGPLVRFVAVGLIAVAGLAVSASGYDKRFELAKARNEGFYASLTGRVQAVSGDFLHDLTLWHFDKAFYIPRLEGGEEYDFGLSLGIGRKTAYGSWEVRYSLALPEAYVNGREQRIQMHELEISGRSFFWPGRILQPYALLGIDLPLVFVHDGASYLGESLDAAYVGVGLEVGAGLVWDIASDTFLDLGIVYRIQGYFYAYGEGKGRDINHLRTVQDGPKLGRLLRSSSLALTASLGFMF